MIRLQPFEACVDTVHDALVVQFVPDFAGQHTLLAAGLHHLADERLAVAVAVGGRGVNIGDATIQCGVERLIDHVAAIFGHRIPTH